MKTFSLDVDIRSLARLGEKIPQIVSTLIKYKSITPTLAALAGDEETLPEILDSEAVTACSQQRSGSLDVVTPLGVLTLSWAYGPRAWFCGMYGAKLRVPEAVLPELKECLLELSVLTNAAYTTIELSEIKQRDVLKFSDRSGLDAPWDYLPDLYWYNYFGKDLTSVLQTRYRMEFDIAGIKSKPVGEGLEISIEGSPMRLPRAEGLVEYLTRTKIFKRYCHNAGFSNGRINFDYTEIRQA